jgi:ATP-binding cassette subfamily A (ABC1) protein 3
MLKNYRNGRIIILTTHFMDEADYLGDRIGVMVKGELMALGSSMYLKNSYGVGYNITFVKNQKIQHQNSKIYEFVKSYISTATLLTNVSS